MDVGMDIGPHPMV